MARQLWIADALRAAGLQVEEIAGWQSRGSASFEPQVLVVHHTAGAAGKPAPSLGICINGRPGLSGPLCQVLLGRDGVFRVIAAGRANHAGAGGFRGVTGNTYSLGLEVENVGTVLEPWTPETVALMHRASAALLKGMGRDASWLCGHKEWAPRRKIDPHSLNMDEFRAAVGAVIAGQPVPIAHVEPAPATAPPETEIDRIRQLQGHLGVAQDGDPGPITTAAMNRQLVGWTEEVHRRTRRWVNLRGNSNEGLVRWLQTQGNRKGYGCAVDGDAEGPETNHLIVVLLGQADGICGPNGFRAACR